MFKAYTGLEYLAIDVANRYGMDKEPFEKRIDWVKANQDNLETYANQADDKPLCIKAVIHFNKARKGLPTGHTVALDAVCSGLQLMSVMTGDESGCYMTGLIDPNKRTDAYSLVTQYMNELLDEDVSITRPQAKDAVKYSSIQ